MKLLITLSLFSMLGVSYHASATDSTQCVRLRTYLAKYTEIKKNGGWPTIVSGRTLKPGDVDERIRLIKKRLIITSDLDQKTVTINDTFDQPLEMAVKQFQLRHHLEPDGIVGKNTLFEMNISVSQRIQQLEINLSRWHHYTIPADTFIFINIASQEFELRYHDSVILHMKVIVGRPTRKTPQLKAHLSSLEFNPFWYIPPGIRRKDILPKIRSTTSFLSSNKIRVYKNSVETDPKNVAWKSVEPWDASYTFIQEPGGTNPMGKIKFLFPNKYFTFMHDTPDTALFARSPRTFSSGCIRLSRAQDLAYILLKKDREWTKPRIDSLISAGKYMKVDLYVPVLIHLAYFTAWIDRSGELMFARDIYRLDL